MAAATEVQVSHFLDEHGLGSFQIKLIIWSALIALIDGYDIGAIAFAAPHLIQEWHISPKELGLVLSASNIGVLFGSQIFGWIGDRYGRKTALILCNFLFGVFTFAAAYSTDLSQLFWLRFVAGLGIGGVIPNMVAINAESAPRNLRATLAIIAAGLVPLGGALAGLRQRGIRAAAWLAGAVPTSAASFRSSSRLARCWACRNRSNSWRCTKASAPRWRRCLQTSGRTSKSRPMRASSSRTKSNSPSSNPVYLFGNGLAAITPLTWLMFACNLMGYFFLISWTPTLMTAAHARRRRRR